MASIIRRDRDKNGKLKPRNRCRVWELQVSTGRQGKGYGKESRMFHGTYQAARVAGSAFENELRGSYPGGKVTFEQYANEWIDAREEHDELAKNTLSEYRSTIRRACKVFGYQNMRDISAEDVEKACQGLSAKTKKTKVVALKAIFRSALDKGLITDNPCTHIYIRPQTDLGPSDHAISAIDIERVCKLLDFENRYHRLVSLCLFAGLRRAEACALRWQDIDDEGIHVRHGCEVDGTLTNTKTYERRTIPIASVLTQLLEYRGGPTERVCEDASVIITPVAFTTWWRRDGRAYFELPGVRIHDLRHTFITQLARAGVHPRVMMELSGHASINVCMNVYTHVNDVQRREAVSDAFSAFSDVS